MLELGKGNMHGCKTAPIELVKRSVIEEVMIQSRNRSGNCEQDESCLSLSSKQIQSSPERLRIQIIPSRSKTDLRVNKKDKSINSQNSPTFLTLRFQIPTPNYLFHEIHPLRILSLPNPHSQTRENQSKWKLNKTGI